VSAFRDPIAWEESLRILPSSPAWRATIRALYGTPLDDDELKAFLTLSGGRLPPEGGADEFEAVVGRRGGKSLTIARLATFEAIHGGHEIALAPGQVGLIPVISPLREQSQEILGYVRGLCALPQVKRHLADEPTRDGVSFKNSIAIRVMTADAVNVSGPTVVCAVLDEFAKFPGDGSVMPDREIVNSLRPALAPLVGAPRRRFVMITSSYIQEGVAFEVDRDNFGKPDAPVFVVRGESTAFNPNLDAKWLERERKRIGEAVFAREYRGIWMPAIVEGYFPMEVVEACVDKGRTESEPDPNVTYHASIDAAFRGDMFALAIACRIQRGAAPAQTDLVGVWTWQARGGPLAVDDTIAKVVSVLRIYDCDMCTADQFAFDPLREAFARRGIYLRQAAWHASTKPAKFARVRAGMTDGIVRLPDDPALVREFCNIRARLLRGSGSEQIEARSGHDDRVHAAVQALNQAMDAAPDIDERHDARPALTAAELIAQREEERIDRLCADFRDEQARIDDPTNNAWILNE
jgi:hypothetical protein